MEATLVVATNKRFWRRLYGTVRILLTTTSLPTSPCHDPLIPSAPIPTQLTHKIYNASAAQAFCNLHTVLISKINMAARTHTHGMFSVQDWALVWVTFWRALKFQSFKCTVGSNPRRQSKNIEMKHKIHIKLVYEFYMIHVSSVMGRIKNQPSNSTSCNDNALRLLVLVLGRL